MPVSKIFANLNVKGGTEQKTTPTFFTGFAKKNHMHQNILYRVIQ